MMNRQARWPPLGRSHGHHRADLIAVTGQAYWPLTRVDVEHSMDVLRRRQPCRGRGPAQRGDGTVRDQCQS